MRIALNIEYVDARRGGAEKYAGTLARALHAAGHEVHVFARAVAAGELPNEIVFHLVPSSRLSRLKAFRAYQFAAVSETMMKPLDFDKIIGFSKVWYQDAYLAVGGSHPASLDYGSRRLRSRVPRILWWLCKYMSLRQWVFRAIARRQFSSGFTPRIIAPSRMVAEHFRRYHGIPGERISVIHNGLDRRDHANDNRALREAFRREQELEASHVGILFVARNYGLKGLEPLLEAFARLARSFPESRLVVCGNDRDGRYRRRAKSLGVEQKTRFLGSVNDVRPCFAGADLFAFPTFYDPCSLVVPEAMAAGLPVITTRQNGAGELLSDGDDGYVIDSPWHIDQMVDRLARLVGDGELRATMGRRAAVRAKELTVEAQTERITTILERPVDAADAISRRNAA